MASTIRAKKEKKKQILFCPKFPGVKRPKGGGSLLFYFLIGLLLLSIFYTFAPLDPPVEDKSFSELLSLISQREIERIEVTGDVLKADLKDGRKISSRKDSQEGLIETLNNSGIGYKDVQIVFKDPASNARVFDLAVNLLPVLLIILFFTFIFRQARGAGSEVFSFGKSRARLFSKDEPRVKFSDVGDVEEAKQELGEVVDFLNNSSKYLALGARIPRGVLLVGPSGTGKTLLARAIAGEANVPFFSMAGSEFMEMLVGVGASRVRDLFQTAKRHAPSLIFIDEVESIGRQRGFGVGGGHDEREQTLNQILVEMDGFAPNTNVIVLAATNRPDLLDPAFVRPGRFDRRVVLDMPDIEGRISIIKIHMRGKPFAQEVSLKKLARRTVGFSGADIENMMNEAAILAARQNRKEITAADLEEAATKVKLGPEKRRLQSEEARRMTAYHEAGHGVVTANLPNSDPVHRISIVSRGLALGFTLTPPKIDRYNETRTRLEEMVTSLMGGRAAEAEVFSEMTVGASSDLERATEIARRMVTEYGMSDLGPISLNRPIESQWPPAYISGTEKFTSEELVAKADREIKKILDICYERASDILRKNRGKLDAVAEFLLEHETIEGDEFAKLLAKA